MANRSQSELLESFADFATRQKLSPVLRAGFEAHVRLAGGNFNYRRPEEWAALYSDFMVADRRRHR